MTNNSKKGFTLVELSIVLVIIGLLIGGILVAQSMITTAKLQSTVRQLGQFDAAVANFYTKFNQIPGDDSVMGTAAGNNDGIIADAAGAQLTFSGEIGKFWADLSASGLKPTGSATGYVDCGDGTKNPSCAAGLTAGQLTSTGATQYIPQTPIGTSVGIMASGAASGSNYYFISSFATSVANPPVITPTSTSALKGADAAAIDSKIDDGSATGGQVTGSATITTIPAATVAACEVGGVYVTSGTTPVCSLKIRLGLNTGNLQ